MLVTLHTIRRVSKDPNASKRLLDHISTCINITSPTHFYCSIIRIVSTIMPTLRLVYLTEQQYADMTANNNTTAEAQLPYIYQQEQTTRLVPIADATRNASSYKPPAVGEEKKMAEQSDHEEDNNGCLDTLLQEATSIDAVNSRSFGNNAVRHQQVQQEEMILSSSDTESENDSSASSERVRVRVLDAVQQFQHEMESSETGSEDDSTAQEDAVQQKSGNKRKRPAKIRVQRQSFDERFNKLMAFKAKCGHCDVSRGENASLAKWCCSLRVSYKKIQNNQMPNIKLSDEQMQRLNNAGFKWSIKEYFDKRFSDLMSFKAKYGHCDVSPHDENPSLRSWCNGMRSSYTKIQNNQKPNMILSAEQIQRLNDAGFKWSLRETFEERFNEIMSFKAKYGHCDVSKTGDYISIWHWCAKLRSSYKKIQNNQEPPMKLSDEQIQRLNDAGFKWSLKETFDEHFNDLMAFKAKYGHCDVPGTGENVPLGKWCSKVRCSYKKIQNNQMPKMKLSDDQIQRLDDAGFKWSLGNFDHRFNDLMLFKVKYGHCVVSCTGENVSLGKWCNKLRASYKNIQNNQKPRMKLSDEQIQRLNDAGFKWSGLRPSGLV
jgi:hypothetical protein